MKNLRIVLAGGGTAGHIEPALAVAGEWLLLHPSDECVFLGTAQGLENTLVPSAGFELAVIPKVVMPRSFSFDLLAFPWQFFASVVAARKVIRKADLLVGFGGYVCASAYVAARLEHVPIVIHEANAKVGWANQLGSLFTKFLAVAYPVHKGRFNEALITGIPLRRDIQNCVESAQSDWTLARNRAKNELGWPLDKPAIAVVGGSQGSASLNKVIAQCVVPLTARGIHILHSVGAKNEIPLSSGGYEAVPYITNMAQVYLAADLIIARSGAVTVAEIGALGQMALFIPLPIGNGEQFKNASELVDAGRAIVLEQSFFTPEWFLENIDSLLEKSKMLPPSTIDKDLHAASKIAALMEHAISSAGEMA